MIGTRNKCILSQIYRINDECLKRNSTNVSFHGSLPSSCVEMTPPTVENQKQLSDPEAGDNTTAEPVL